VACSTLLGVNLREVLSLVFMPAILVIAFFVITAFLGSVLAFSIFMDHKEQSPAPGRGE